jgi:hypothetical protein
LLNANLCEKSGLAFPVDEISPLPTGKGSAAAEPTATSAPAAELPARVPPGFLPDAVIIIADEHGCYPSDRRFFGPYMWTWIGADAWFYVKDFPVPVSRKANA